MLNKLKKYKAPLVFLGCILWVFGGWYYSTTYHANMRSKPKGYVYETYWGTVNHTLYVNNKRNIDSLVAYYRKIENGDTMAFFNFPPLTLPYDSCVYILGYEKDSVVAKVISYYDYGKNGEFVKGYVYIHTLHNTPPPDSLIIKH